MVFTYASSLTNAGGTVALDVSGALYEQINSEVAGPGIFRRHIVSGTISTVPVPAAVWLFGSALAGLVCLRRKPTV